MLESLVSSRIRRSLFEHILAHPQERFYLRGLAKELGLSISPLRRELKRLAQTRVLNAVQEGNILFYTVDTSSPLFLQLTQAARSTAVPASVSTAPTGWAPSEDSPKVAGPRPNVAVGRTPMADGQDVQLPATGNRPPATFRPPASGHAIPVGIISARSASAWKSPLAAPVLIGAAGIGMALVLIVVGLAYVGMTNRELVSQASKALTTRKAEVTVVMPSTSSSGAMRSGRWRVVPGGFGGFGSPSNPETF